MKIKTTSRTLLADMLTPVSVYLNLRDKYPNSILLESSDYHSKENAFSFIGLNPVASFEVNNNIITTTVYEQSSTQQISKPNQVIEVLELFIENFQVTGDEVVNGLFGYTTYDAVTYFDTVQLTNRNGQIPEMKYSFYKHVIQFNHFKNELTLIENLSDQDTSELVQLEMQVKNNFYPKYNFKMIGNEQSNLTDDEYKNMVTKAKEHCQLGDVFQLVLSRQFFQKFKGDDFNVYRALRSVNPSPYLFYFDYGSFKLFGSSPEAQLKVQESEAVINPIAGTFKRTGKDEEDKKLAVKLSNDPKENAEHNMLVDLARNDLSKHGKKVKVTSYKEVQFYSHVIHLVSEVKAAIDPKKNIQLFADTFPAGTLSGAPKYRAMELIDKYEKDGRGYYGGAVGYFGFDGTVNHAIAIRSFLSKNNTLISQAGAGVVIDSNEEDELKEVSNKLGALKKALTLAENI